jgi:hypothetical protein
MPDPSQKLRGDVFRDTYRASEFVCQHGPFSGQIRKLIVSETGLRKQRHWQTARHEKAGTWLAKVGSSRRSVSGPTINLPPGYQVQAEKAQTGQDDRRWLWHCSNGRECRLERAVLSDAEPEEEGLRIKRW